VACQAGELTIALLAKRSRQGRRPGNPDVANAIAPREGGRMTNAIAGNVWLALAQRRCSCPEAVTLWRGLGRQIAAPEHWYRIVSHCLS